MTFLRLLFVLNIKLRCGYIHITVLLTGKRELDYVPREEVRRKKTLKSMDSLRRKCGYMSWNKISTLILKCEQTFPNKTCHVMCVQSHLKMHAVCLSEGRKWYVTATSPSLFPPVPFWLYTIKYSHYRNSLMFLGNKVFSVMPTVRWKDWYREVSNSVFLATRNFQDVTAPKQDGVWQKAAQATTELFQIFYIKHKRN